MKRKIKYLRGWTALIFLGVGIFSIPNGGTVAAGRSGNFDLTVLNHPDLFKVRGEKSKKPPLKSSAAQANPTTPTVSPKIEFHKSVKEKPIPLDQVDASLIQRVFFDFDQAVLKPEAKAGIQTNTAWFKKHLEYDLLLEGHCDERGTNEYNLVLGERRAQAVRAYMIEFGVDPKRLALKSWGKEKPLDFRRTEEAYRLNRRVEFYAIPK